MNWVLLAWGITEMRRMLKRLGKVEVRHMTHERLIVAMNQRVENVDFKLDQWNQLRRVTPFERPRAKASDE